MAIQPSAQTKILAICEKYQAEPSPLMPILEDVQREFGYVPLDVQALIAERLSLPASEVYGVVTFYNFFNLDPKGKYVIGVCLGTACYVKNGQSLLDRFEKTLGIVSGQTTADGLFTLDTIRCLGACALAPVVAVNGKVYASMTADKVEPLIAEYRKKELSAQ